MSQEKLDVVRRVIEAFNRRDFDAVLEGFDPECEVVPLVAGTYRGHAGWRRLIDGALTDVPGLRFHEDTFREGMVIRQESFRNKAEALDAVGLGDG